MKYAEKIELELNKYFNLLIERIHGNFFDFKIFRDQTDLCILEYAGKDFKKTEKNSYIIVQNIRFKYIDSVYSMESVSPSKKIEKFLDGSIKEIPFDVDNYKIKNMDYLPTKKEEQAFHNFMSSFVIDAQLNFAPDTI